MKYVKTEGGIHLLDDLGCVHHPFNGMPIHKSYLEVIKESDAVEELIDEFVFEGVDEPPSICDSYDELIYWFNHSKEEQYTTRNCYGAIWTDKGLIYVAKMNEKGEWELI